MKITLLSLCFAASYAFSQSVADYSLVSVVSKSKDFAANKYGLETQLASVLTKKNYRPLGTDRLSWPAASQNPCNVLTANIINTSGMLRNKVSVDFRDCNDKSVAKYEGTSLEKDFETGYPDALLKAVSQVPQSKGMQPHETVLAANTPPVISTEVPLNTSISQTGSSAEIYSNAGQRLNLIRLSQAQFILAGQNSSIPFAVFRTTTKADVFRVQLADGQQTIGYTENQNIVIEMPAQDGTYRKEIFVKQ